MMNHHTTANKAMRTMIPSMDYVRLRLLAIDITAKTAKATAARANA